MGDVPPEAGDVDDDVVVVVAVVLAGCDDDDDGAGWVPVVPAWRGLVARRVEEGEFEPAVATEASSTAHALAAWVGSLNKRQNSGSASFKVRSAMIKKGCWVVMVVRGGEDVVVPAEAVAAVAEALRPP